MWVLLLNRNYSAPEDSAKPMKGNAHDCSVSRRHESKKMVLRENQEMTYCVLPEDLLKDSGNATE